MLSCLLALSVPLRGETVSFVVRSGIKTFFLPVSSALASRENTEETFRHALLDQGPTQRHTREQAM